MNKKVIIAVAVVVILLICCLVSIVLLFTTGTLKLNLPNNNSNIITQSQITDAITQKGQVSSTPEPTVTLTPTTKPSTGTTVQLTQTCVSDPGSDTEFTVKIPGNWICTSDSFPNGDQLIMLAPDNSLQLIITNAPSDVPCSSEPACKQEKYYTSSVVELTHIFDGNNGELRGLLNGDYVLQVSYPNSEKSVPGNLTAQLLKQIVATIKKK
jgi:hypothetical protein